MNRVFRNSLSRSRVRTKLAACVSTGNGQVVQYFKCAHVVFVQFCNNALYLPSHLPLDATFYRKCTLAAEQDTAAGDRCEAILRVWRQRVPDRT